MVAGGASAVSGARAECTGGDLRPGGRGELEQTLRALYWLRGMGLLRSGIVIETEDLTDTGLTLAEKLIQRYPAAELK